MTTIKVRYGGGFVVPASGWVKHGGTWVQVGLDLLKKMSPLGWDGRTLVRIGQNSMNDWTAFQYTAGRFWHMMSMTSGCASWAPGESAWRTETASPGAPLNQIVDFNGQLYGWNGSAAGYRFDPGTRTWFSDPPARLNSSTNGRIAAVGDSIIVWGTTSGGRFERWIVGGGGWAAMSKPSDLSLIGPTTKAWAVLGTRLFVCYQNASSQHVMAYTDDYGASWTNLGANPAAATGSYYMAVDHGKVYFFSLTGTAGCWVWNGSGWTRITTAMTDSTVTGIGAAVTDADGQLWIPYNNFLTTTAVELHPSTLSLLP